MCHQAYPGDKHACAALLYALPATGVSLECMQSLMWQQLDQLADQGPTAAELQRIKKVGAFWAALARHPGAECISIPIRCHLALPGCLCTCYQTPICHVCPLAMFWRGSQGNFAP